MRFHGIVRVALIPALLAAPILGAQNPQTMGGHGGMSMAAAGGRSSMLTSPMGTRGPSGVATVDGAVVSLTLQADVVGATRSWSIHKGSCGRDQGFVGTVESYPPLTIDPQGNGTANARLAAPLADGAYFVAVHGAASDPASAFVACGALAEAMNSMPMGTVPMGTMPMGTMPMGTMPMGSDSTSTRLMAIYSRMMADPVVRERVMTDPVLQRMLAGLDMADSMAMPMTTPAIPRGTAEAAARHRAPATGHLPRATASKPSIAPAKSVGPFAVPRNASPAKAAVKPPTKKDSMPGMKMPAGMKMPPAKTP
jgi:hypothetical protein